MHEYRAICVKVVDGDTVDLEVDLGFRMKFTDRFRLHGINAPEVRGEERQAGIAAKNWLIGKLFDLTDVPGEEPTPKPLIIQTIKDHKRGKYGRWLVKIFEDDDNYVSHLNDQMADAGHAASKDY